MGICFGVQSADRQLGAVTVRASRATSPRTRDSPPPAWGSPASGARAPIHPSCVQPDPRICRHSWLRSNLEAANMLHTFFFLRFQTLRSRVPAPGCQSGGRSPPAPAAARVVSTTRTRVGNPSASGSRTQPDGARGFQPNPAGGVTSGRRPPAGLRSLFASAAALLFPISACQAPRTRRALWKFVRVQRSGACQGRKGPNKRLVWSACSRRTITQERTDDGRNRNLSTVMEHLFFFPFAVSDQSVSQLHLVLVSSLK